jgi:hypothetical protein
VKKSKPKLSNEEMLLIKQAKKALESHGLNAYEVFALDEFKTLSEEGKLQVRLSAE